jgi:hypothetical protein
MSTTQIRAHAAGDRVDRPAWVWPAVLIEIVTGVAAIPVGRGFLADPTGAGMGLPSGWIENTIFGSYFIPGLYLIAVNGFAMLATALLSARRHWTAPWLTGVLGVGLVIWILVQLAVMPETMFLQWFFLAAGLWLAATSVAWLRHTGQLAALMAHGRDREQEA